MPNRLLRDWTDSARLDGISAEAERLFIRLIMKADDYGRFHADPRLLKAGCFPLLDNLRVNDISAWLKELTARELILCYKAQDRDYLAILNFGQRLKQSRPKFPPPPDNPRIGSQPLEASGTSGNSRPGTETKSDTETNTETEFFGEASKTPLADTSPPALEFPCVGNGSRTWALTEVKLAEYRESFPGLDVMAQCRAARQWCIDNPSKRKTDRGMAAFLTRWLSREQNKIGGKDVLRAPHRSARAANEWGGQALSL